MSIMLLKGSFTEESQSIAIMCSACRRPIINLELSVDTNASQIKYDDVESVFFKWIPEIQPPVSILQVV